MLRALIWDVDGTLAETEHHGHRVAFNQAFADEGLPWVWDEATYARLLATAGGQERLLVWWREVAPHTADAPATAAQIRHLHALKTAHYAALVRRGAVQLRPGVQRLLVEARAAGLRLAIATTTSRPNVDELLAATLGLQALAWFEVIATGEDVAAKKPAPEVYHLVRQRLALRADQCLAIEDSAIGASAASAAGLPLLVTRSHYTRADLMPAALADLDGLGRHDEPAHGLVAGRPWQGMVDVHRLQVWRHGWGSLARAA